MSIENVKTIFNRDTAAQLQVEAMADIPATDYTTLVEWTYSNLLGLEDVSQERIQFWVDYLNGDLERGQLAAEDLAETFMDLAENEQGQLTAEEFAYNQSATAAVTAAATSSDVTLADLKTAAQAGAEEPGAPSDLTEAVTDYQAALTAEDAALEELAMNGQEADISEADLNARKANIADGTIDPVADAEAAVAAEDQDLRDAQSTLATQRAADSDSELRAEVTDLQSQINSSDADVAQGGLTQTISEFQNDLVQAENALSSDRNSDGSDLSASEALSAAITAYLEAGGTDVNVTGTTALSDIVAQVAAESTVVADNQAFDELLVGNSTPTGVNQLNDSLAALIDADGNYDGTTLEGANSDLRTALRDAAVVVGQRAGLIEERNTADTNFTTAPVYAPVTLEADVTGADFTDASAAADIEVNGTTTTIAGNGTDFSDQASFLTAVEALDGVESATISNNTLTIVSSNADATVQDMLTISNSNDGNSGDFDVAQVSADTLGQAFVDAENAVEAREEDIQDVADAEEDLAEAQAALDEVEALVASYEDAVDNREELATVLAEEFGVENIVDLTDSNEAGTSNEADLYIFSEDTDTGLVMTNFEADDQLFLGTEFTRTDIDAGVDLTETREGDADALEVFVQQDGANTILFVEQFEGAGNAQSDDELVQITLNGVNAEDLDFSAGFLTVA
ncbi:hypothetical protein [Vreelandella massiliensis]|uniref:hypothetical protein n=1 Tax=Vreelandella massiliensis TaxID=1816686 RepID=UPI00096A6864|nr:hypothetical protein [Halomonas massiliensis]